MRVLAIDPGYDRLGVAILEKKQGKEYVLYSGCFQTQKKDVLSKRIFAAGEELERLIVEFKPTICASEGLFFAKNQKTAIDVAGIRGVIMYIAEKYNLPLFEYTPLQIKVAVTGYGKSDKSQVIDMVTRLVSVEKKVATDDEYDAIAVGLTCLAIEH